jgi:hypothetical protein
MVSEFMCAHLQASYIAVFHCMSLIMTGDITGHLTIPPLHFHFVYESCFPPIVICKHVFNRYISYIISRLAFIGMTHVLEAALQSIWHSHKVQKSDLTTLLTLSNPNLKKRATSVAAPPHLSHQKMHVCLTKGLGLKQILDGPCVQLTNKIILIYN